MVNYSGNYRGKFHRDTCFVSKLEEIRKRNHRQESWPRRINSIIRLSACITSQLLARRDVPSFASLCNFLTDQIDSAIEADELHRTKTITRNWKFETHIIGEKSKRKKVCLKKNFFYQSQENRNKFNIRRIWHL